MHDLGRVAAVVKDYQCPQVVDSIDQPTLILQHIVCVELGTDTAAGQVTRHLDHVCANLHDLLDPSEDDLDSPVHHLPIEALVQHWIHHEVFQAPVLSELVESSMHAGGDQALVSHSLRGSTDQAGIHIVGRGSVLAGNFEILFALDGILNRRRDDEVGRCSFVFLGPCDLSPWRPNCHPPVLLVAFSCIRNGHIPIVPGNGETAIVGRVVCRVEIPNTAQRVEYIKSKIVAVLDELDDGIEIRGVEKSLDLGFVAKHLVDIVVVQERSNGNPIHRLSLEGLE